MELSEIYQERFANDSLKISFEIYPPVNNDISTLYEELRMLKRFEPVAIILTQTSRNGVNRFSVADIKSIRDLEFEIIPQISCVNCIQNELEKQITNIENLGIESVMVKLGKIPDYLKNEELDFNECNELITYLKDKTTLSIGTYSETNDNSIAAINRTQKEIESGAVAIFTTPFKSNGQFYTFTKNLRKHNIKVPIIAGVSTDIETEECIRKCKDLIEFGTSGLHFYTNSNTEKIIQILENIL